MKNKREERELLSELFSQVDGEHGRSKVACLGGFATPLAENADWVEHFVAVEENKDGDHHCEEKEVRMKKFGLPMKPEDMIKYWIQVAQIAQCVFFGCISVT
jgi:hypothetical protein